MHIAMSSVIQLDNFIHPMVLFVNCLNCISINLYGLTYKMEESHIKNYKPWKRGRGGGNKTFLAPVGHFLMYVDLFRRVALMTKILS